MRLDEEGGGGCTARGTLDTSLVAHAVQLDSWLPPLSPLPLPLSAATSPLSCVQVLGLPAATTLMGPACLVCLAMLAISYDLMVGGVGRNG